MIIQNDERRFLNHDATLGDVARGTLLAAEMSQGQERVEYLLRACKTMNSMIGIGAVDYEAALEQLNRAGRAMIRGQVNRRVST